MSMGVLGSKAQYRALCDAEPSIPLFSQAWWLDAVAEGCWDVALVETGGEVKASMPYVIRKRGTFTLISQPPLTQNLGPWMRGSSAKYAKRLGEQKKAFYALIEQLPRFDYFNQNWHYNNTNWQPFYWRGFQQTTRYTYVLHELQDEKALWEGMQENIRGDIRKARRRFGLEVSSEASLEEFRELNRKVFHRQGRILPYSEDVVERIDEACARQGCRRIFVARDCQGRGHAGVYMVWNENSAYYLLGGGDPELRNSGATSLCMWEAIQFASTVTKRFDFEGSMLERVERFFRAFGATQTPYINVSKINSRILKIREFAKVLAERRR